MNDSPSSNQPGAAKMQAVVDYLPGISIVGAKSAMLEWSADDRIKLFVMDYSTDPAQATEVLFDVPVGEITNISGSMAMLVFRIGDKKYNVQFSRTGAAKLGLGGAVGVGLSVADTSSSALPEWVKRLQLAGVSIKGYQGWGWSITVASILVVIILVIVVVVSI